MSSWISILPPLLTGVTLITILGAPLALALRARGLAFALITVPAAFAVIAVASVITPFVRVGWSAVPPFLLTAALSIILWFTMRKQQLAHVRSPRRNILGPLLAVGASSILLVYVFVKSLPDAGAFSQTYDAVFHLNAIQYIIDTGSASPLDLDLASPGAETFYPSLWHAFVTLIVQVSGAEITVASNAAAILVLVLVWSIGAVGLGRAVAGNGATATTISSIMAVAFPAFPLMFLSYGVLYPNLLSMALLPFALIAIFRAFNIGLSRRTDPLPSTFATTLLGVGAVGAATFAHPNALHNLFLFALPFVVFATIRTLRLGISWRSFATLVACVAYLGFGVVLWVMAQGTASPWGGSEGPFGALIEALGTNPIFEGHNWILSFVVFIGILYAIIRPSLRPFVLGLAIVLAFFVIAEGFPPSHWRTVILAPWYSDPWRLSALLPFMMLPLGVLGGTLLAKTLLPGFRRCMALLRNRRMFIGTAQAALVSLFGVALIGTSLYGVSGKLDEGYLSIDDDARVISPDERALLERVDDHVPENARIMTNPWNGGSLAYAVTGREVLIPHLAGNYPATSWNALAGITRGVPEACAAAEELNARYLLDFGTRFVFRVPERMQPELAAISGIRYAPALTEVDREGEAVLYEITGCNW